MNTFKQYLLTESDSQLELITKRGTAFLQGSGLDDKKKQFKLYVVDETKGSNTKFGKNIHYYIIYIDNGTPTRAKELKKGKGKDKTSMIETWEKDYNIKTLIKRLYDEWLKS